MILGDDMNVLEGIDSIVELHAGAYCVLERVHSQANDIDLWTPGATSKEIYLQSELRKLHEAIEKNFSDLVQYPAKKEA